MLKYNTYLDSGNAATLFQRDIPHARARARYVYIYISVALLLGIKKVRKTKAFSGNGGLLPRVAGVAALLKRGKS